MTRNWQRLMVLAAVALAMGLVHALAARALIDHGVAGALLAGGGGWGTIAAAAGFLLFRLVCFVGLAAIPAALVWRWLSPRPDLRCPDLRCPATSAGAASGRSHRLRGRASPY